MMRRLSAYSLLVALALSATVARADIYGYIDENGEGHFSTEKLDERYKLFQHGGQVFDSTKLGGMDATEESSPQLARYLTQHPNLKKYEPLVNQAAQEYAVEPALLKAVMAAESGFNPNAVSPKGAIGLMQLMPATAERYGLQGDRKKNVQQKLTDPKTNIWLAAHYLSDLGKMFEGRLDLVVASYNAGEAAVQKHNNAIPPYPETRNYVEIVTRIYKMYKPASDAQTATRMLAANGNVISPQRIQIVIPTRQHAEEPAQNSIPDL